jgi:hypothetical protein
VGHRGRDPDVTLSGEVRDLLAEPEWNLRLTAERLDWPPSAAEPALSLHDLVVDSQGTMASHDLQAEARIDGDGLPALQARVVGAGDRSGVDIELLELAGEDLQLEGAGRFDWLPAASVRLNATSRASIPAWFAAWNGGPGQRPRGVAWSAGSSNFGLRGRRARRAGGARSGSLNGNGSTADGKVTAELVGRVGPGRRERRAERLQPCGLRGSPAALLPDRQRRAGAERPGPAGAPVVEGTVIGNR